MKKNTLQVPRWTVGLDVGDEYCHLAVVDRAGNLVGKSRVATEESALRKQFFQIGDARQAIESSTRGWASFALD